MLREKTIVGANSFVNRSFGPDVKICGNPAKEIISQHGTDHGSS